MFSLVYVVAQLNSSFFVSKEIQVLQEKQDILQMGSAGYLEH